MTTKEVARRNNLSFFLVGIVFTALGIYDWSAGNRVSGILFTVAGLIAVVQVPAGMIRRRKHSGKG